MKCNHKSAKLDALLNQTVKIYFFDGSMQKGILYDRDSAIKRTGQILGNAPYFLLYDGVTLGFYKTHVRTIVYNGGIEIKGGSK